MRGDLRLRSEQAPSSPVIEILRAADPLRLGSGQAFAPLTPWTLPRPKGP